MKITNYTLSAATNKDAKFVFISDLHGYDNDKILNEINKINPDTVLVGGDMVHDDKNYKDGIEFLRLCSEKYPTFCSLGNHEMKLSVDIRAMIRESGAILLDNEFSEHCGIKIGGLSTGYQQGDKQGRTKTTPCPNMEFANSFAKESGYKILLSHHPEYYGKYLKDLDINLILSGHAHGGQWRLFGRGVFAPGQGLFPKYTSGMYDNKLIVSRGIGNQMLVPRINNSKEIIVLNFKGEEN
jgi:predicted MPP superfamily phosphohydrolase